MNKQGAWYLCLDFWLFQTIVQGENEGGEGSFEFRISAKEKENGEHRAGMKRNEKWNEEQFGGYW